MFCALSLGRVQQRQGWCCRDWKLRSAGWGRYALKLESLIPAGQGDLELPTWEWPGIAGAVAKRRERVFYAPAAALRRVARYIATTLGRPRGRV